MDKGFIRNDTEFFYFLDVGGEIGSGFYFGVSGSDLGKGENGRFRLEVKIQNILLCQKSEMLFRDRTFLLHPRKRE